MSFLYNKKELSKEFFGIYIGGIVVPVVYVKFNTFSSSKILAIYWTI